MFNPVAILAKRSLTVTASPPTLQAVKLLFIFLLPECTQSIPSYRMFLLCASGIQCHYRQDELQHTVSGVAGLKSFAGHSFFITNAKSYIKQYDTAGSTSTGSSRAQRFVQLQMVCFGTRNMTSASPLESQLVRQRS